MEEELFLEELANHLIIHTVWLPHILSLGEIVSLVTCFLSFIHNLPGEEVLAWESRRRFSLELLVLPPSLPLRLPCRMISSRWPKNIFIIKIIG